MIDNLSLLKTEVNLQEHRKWGDEMAQEVPQDLNKRYPKQSEVSAKSLWELNCQES